MKTAMLVFGVLTVAAGCDSGGANPAYYGGGTGLGGSSPVASGSAGASNAGTDATERDAGTAGVSAIATPDSGADATPPHVTRTLTLENCSDAVVSMSAVSSGGDVLTPADPVPPATCTTTCGGGSTPTETNRCISFAPDGAGCGGVPNVPPGCSCTQEMTPGRSFVTVSCVADTPIVIELSGAASLATTCSDVTVYVGGAGVGPCKGT